MAKQSIYDWVAITKNEKGGWSRFYKEFTGWPLSDIPRLNKLVEDFGHELVFESILACSGRKLTSDPVNYVSAIVMSKAQDEVKDAINENTYKMRLEQAKDLTQQKNEELEELIEKARKVSHGTDS